MRTKLLTLGGNHMRNKVDFSEKCIRQLFGPEAAEDEDIERLKEYYFKGDIYEKIHNDMPLKILVGHKGIGKSATFKISYHENCTQSIISVWIRPDDILEVCQESENLLMMIRDWKKGLFDIIYHKVLEHVGLNSDPDPGVVNYTGKLISKVTDSLKSVIEQKVDLSNIKTGLISSYLKRNRIYVYIDDLDRGWKGSESDVLKISALLNAVRDMTNDNKGLCVRVSLRSDVYFLVRTSDESTDKIEGAVVWYSWTQHQILVMLAKRIQSYFGNHVEERILLKTPQFKIAELFNDVFEDRFYAQGKWADVPTYKVLASMIRRRPRDLVKLCTLAAKTAREKRHEIIDTNDFIDNFDYYSQERIQDTINEYSSELPAIERLLMGMKPSKRERHTSEEFIYSSDELFKKIEIIQGNKPFVYSRGAVASIEELAAFLYKINFLVARKRVESGGTIDRRYFEDNKYLSNRFVDFGYKWEVHPAFRWALYPDAGSDIFLSLDIDNEI